jgi:anti-sigma factor RsiW
MNSEERYNRWIDGTLPDSERAALRADLAAAGIAETERDTVLRAGELLRRTAAPLEHADAFREQILDRIRSEVASDDRRASRSSRPTPRFGLAWSGLTLVALAIIGFAFLIPKPWDQSTQSEVYSVWSEADAVSAVAVHTPDHSASVVWLDGLEYIPSEHAIR